MDEAVFISLRLVHQLFVGKWPEPKHLKLSTLRLLLGCVLQCNAQAELFPSCPKADIKGGSRGLARFKLWKWHRFMGLPILSSTGMLKNSSLFRVGVYFRGAEASVLPP